MHSSKDIFATGVVASTDYSAEANRYKVVELTAGLEDQPGQVTLSNGQGEYCFGVLQNCPNTGETAEVKIFGRSPVVYGGSVTAGQPLTSSGNGKVEAAASGDYVLGTALEDGVDGEIHDALINFISQGKA